MKLGVRSQSIPKSRNGEKKLGKLLGPLLPSVSTCSILVDATRPSLQCATTSHRNAKVKRIDV